MGLIESDHVFQGGKPVDSMLTRAAIDTSACDRVGVFGGRLVGRVDLSPPERATDAWFFEQPVTIETLGDLMLGRVNRDDATLEAEHARVELSRFVDSGGGLVVELSVTRNSRDVKVLRQLAEETGVKIASAVEIRPDDAQILEYPFTDGITGLFFARSAEGWSRAAWKVVATIAAPVVVDIAGCDPISVVSDALDAGVAPSKIAVMNASDYVRTPEMLGRLVQQGVCIVFDRLGRIPTIRTVTSDHSVAVAIGELVTAGSVDQILLGVGLDRKHEFTSFGGHGLRFIPSQFLPYLRRFGISEVHAHQIGTVNLERFLYGKAV